MLPLFPQYSASTTASAFDAVAAHLSHVGGCPGLRFVETFHADDGYIKALAQNVNDYWVKHGRPGKLVLFLPRRPAADPRAAAIRITVFCQMTARLLARELGLAPEQWTLAFQSRFGRATWLRRTRPRCCGPPSEGVQRVDVFCPGFVADCLETLEEIGIEGRALFSAAGGRAPC